MGSKLILGLFLLAMVLLMISCEVTAARELAETSSNAVATSTNEKTNGAEEVNQYGGGGYGGRDGYGGAGGRSGYGRGRGGYCRYGCCGRSYYRRDCRCCNYAGEKKVVDAPQVKPAHN